jgi:phytoene synthase
LLYLNQVRFTPLRFRREVYAVADEGSDPGVARTKLAWWQAEVAQSFAGAPTHPVMKALMPLAADYRIEARHLQAVIEGCQMDLEQTRYLDFAGLQRYCHLVAGIVGEVAAGIFGQTDPQTTVVKTGPFQLTIRDMAKTLCAGASTCQSTSCSSSTSRRTKS